MTLKDFSFLNKRNTSKSLENKKGNSIFASTNSVTHPIGTAYHGGTFINQSRTSMTTNVKDTISNYFASQPVTKAWIFGSYSRGEETLDSDIDIMVALDPKERVGLRFFQMQEDLKSLLGREIDLVTESSLLPFARENAERDKQLVYERSY